MKIAYFLVIGMLLCIILLTANPVLAQDWPQWRGSGRDAKVADFTPPAVWPQQLTEKWKTNVGTGDATPALVGDKLYVFARQGDQEVTLCLDAATGKELWKDQYPAPAVTGAAARHPGPRSSLAIAEGKVITLGVSGAISCLNAADGKMVWRKEPFPNVVPRFFTASSPLIIDGMVIAQLGGQGNGGILALNLADGEKKWEWLGEAPDYASPVLLTVDGTKQVVTLTEKSVVGVALADGKLLWQIPFAPTGRAYNAATPIIDGQTVIYAGAGRGTFAVKIEKQGETFVPKELWKNTDIAPQFNTSILKNGLLFGFSSSGNLFCISAADGQTKWQDSNSRDRSGFGEIVDAGSVLIALPSSGMMVVYKPIDTAFEEIAQIQVSQTPVYAYPVITGNRIFIKDQDNAALYAIE